MSCSNSVFHLRSRRRPLFATSLALLAGTALFAPEARASEAQFATDVQLAGDPPRRQRTPGPLKPGGYIEVAWRPAIGIFRDGAIPEMRLSVSIGGRLSSRFILAAHPHADLYLDRPSASGVGIDLLGTLYTKKRLFLRAGVGVASAVPNLRSDKTSRPGLGGLVGIGYDWHLKKKINMGVGADLDMRWFKDGTPRAALITGVHFWFG